MVRRRSVAAVAGTLAVLSVAAGPLAPAHAARLTSDRPAAVPVHRGAARRPGHGAANHAQLIRIGSAPLLPLGTQPLAGVSAAMPLRVTVALQPRDPAALSAYAAAVSNPASSRYGHYLTPAQFAGRFGASAAAIATVRGALQRAGLRPGALEANHLSLDVVAPAGDLERGLHVELGRVLLPDHRAALVNFDAPALPAPAGRAVQAIIGLNGLATMRASLARPATRVHAATALGRAVAAPDRSTTATHRRTRQIPAPCAAASGAAAAQGAYTANQIAGAYRFSGLYGAGDEGAGVTIGVYELEPDAPSDIAAYQACYGTDTAVSYVPVDGGVGSGDGSGEAAFDIEQLIGLAPKANLLVYQGPNSNNDNPGSGPYDTFAAMISQDRVSVITNSWGECEAQEGITDARAENTLFEEAAIQGQTVLSASGDNGSEDCLSSFSTPDVNLAVDDPGSQPYVTDVGGTSLTALGPPPTEVAWNSGGSALFGLGLAAGAGAGGGGISSFWPMPAYQSGAPASLHVLNALSSSSPCGNSSGDCREVPDVSADADPAHGYAIYYNGNHAEAGQPAGWQATGGTSGAAPVWAALLALTDADRACAGEPIGFANPALYAAAATGEGTLFNDVTSGNNDFTDSHHGLYPATVGYDMATGLGTPNATALAAALCADSLRVSVPRSLQSFVHVTRSLAVRASPGAGGRVTLTVRGLPPGERFDTTDDRISGTPNRPGTYIVRVTATDPAGTTRRSAFVWDVAGRPSVSHLRLRFTGTRPTLSLRVSAGRAEAGLTEIELSLPRGLTFAGKRRLSLTDLATRRGLRYRLAHHGATLTLRLAHSASPVYVAFAAGSLRANSGLLAAARRRRPALRLSLGVEVTDATGARSGLRARALA
ncbi:protease pro-enzyme activation domain-containing protein [Conexibacter sp. DBS9H8]|uniref:protease pro-enzyme activation domain-containing protein n=1 Tax=Conexibacter sp. DBS9H8 TaxID=2937801 RepID=UPI00200E4DEC|nr:protease pro-enzyme activation domain-containing protein [Conexibacter sp. DBS9H8]